MLTDSSMDNIEAQILANLYNPKQPGFLSAYITGRQYSHLKPRWAMRSLPSPEEAAVIELIHKASRTPASSPTTLPARMKTSGSSAPENTGLKPSSASPIFASEIRA